MSEGKSFVAPASEDILAATHSQVEMQNDTLVVINMADSDYCST